MDDLETAITDRADDLALLLRRLDLAQQAAGQGIAVLGADSEVIPAFPNQPWTVSRR